MADITNNEVFRDLLRMMVGGLKTELARQERIIAAMEKAERAPGPVVLPILRGSNG